MNSIAKFNRIVMNYLKTTKFKIWKIQLKLRNI
jgi:hypothetical protein